MSLCVSRDEKCAGGGKFRWPLTEKLPTAPPSVPGFMQNVGQPRIQSVDNSGENSKRKVLLATFDRTVVGAVHRDTVRERILAQLECFSAPTNRRTECRLQPVFHHGKHARWPLLS